MTYGVPCVVLDLLYNFIIPQYLHMSTHSSKLSSDTFQHSWEVLMLCHPEEFQHFQQDSCHIDFVRQFVQNDERKFLLAKIFVFSIVQNLTNQFRRNLKQRI